MIKRPAFLCLLSNLAHSAQEQNQLDNIDISEVVFPFQWQEERVKKVAKQVVQYRISPLFPVLQDFTCDYEIDGTFLPDKPPDNPQDLGKVRWSKVEPKNIHLYCSAPRREDPVVVWSMTFGRVSSPMFQISTRQKHEWDVNPADNVAKWFTTKVSAPVLNRIGQVPNYRSPGRLIIRDVDGSEYALTYIGDGTKTIEIQASVLVREWSRLDHLEALSYERIVLDTRSMHTDK